MQRIQRQHTRGWRVPDGAIYVGTPTQWANHHAIYIYGWKKAVELYRQDIERMAPAAREAWLAPLRQASALMCWCPLHQPCHADVLIEYLDRPST
jgi:Domain of unknown function (DUF4326)